jgi:calcium-dependent protein kinase
MFNSMFPSFRRKGTGDGRTTGDHWKQVKKKYILKDIVGRGTFGVVRKCIHKKSKKEFAVKSILKSKVKDSKALRREIDVLAEVDHPNIIHLQDIFENDQYLHIVTELCTGGELYDKVVELAKSPPPYGDGHFSEFDAARILHNILDAIQYCHQKGIVHRDLKAENFLLLHDGMDSPIKIIDFGLSRYTSEGGIMQSRVGTPYYVAPEVLLAEEYDAKCDVWSIGGENHTLTSIRLFQNDVFVGMALGERSDLSVSGLLVCEIMVMADAVIAYILLSGHPPFLGEDERDTLRLVKEAELEFRGGDWGAISKEGKEFVKALLTKDPTQRPTAKEALEHPWLQQRQIVFEDMPKGSTFTTPEFVLQHQASDATLGTRLSYQSEKQGVFQKMVGKLRSK